MVLVQGPTGWRFLVSEVPPIDSSRREPHLHGYFPTTENFNTEHELQGCLTHKKTHPPRTLP